MTEAVVLTEKQAKFQNRVIAWRCMLDIFGTWAKAARHFKTTKPLLLRYILDDLEKAWGSKLNWKDVKWDKQST